MTITIVKTPGPELPSPAITLTWGANLLTVANFARVNGESDAVERAGLGPEAEATCPINGVLDTLSWNAQFSLSNTIMKVLVNASVVETLTLNGTFGLALLTAPVAARDEIAIEFDAAEAPGQSNWVIMIEKLS